jgi:hypothetical protein
MSTLWADTLEGFWTSDLRPEEILLRNFWFAALFDVGAFTFLDEHCPTHGMVETDYPHTDTMWPNSRAHLAKRMAALSPEATERFLYRNAVELYRHPVPQLPE